MNSITTVPSISNITNLRNRVNKLYIPKTKPLLPLFEIVSNSIHAIFEKKEYYNFDGKILINLIRNGAPEILEESININDYPIKSFEIIDNGIGLNSENFQSFQEFDSEKKSKIGGKGVGRLVCLKLFKKLHVESYYIEDSVCYVRTFDYKKSVKEGFENYFNEVYIKNQKTGTKVILEGFEENYQKKSPTQIFDIARELINHFQLYFIEKVNLEIILKNQDGLEVNLNKIFQIEFESKILDDTFVLGNFEFKVYITKSFKAHSHKLFYCAHERIVKDEGLSKYIEDLRYMIFDEINKDGYFYQVFVLSKFLDQRVNEERTNFHFTEEEDDDEIEDEITFGKIRKCTLEKIELLLQEFLSKARKEKIDRYLPIIQQEFPNYSSVIQYNREKVEKIPSGLNSNELDIKLYEIESEWRIDVKKKGVKLLDEKKDITESEEYKNLYDKFWSEFNDIGKTDLARYVIHRRSVIDILDKLIEWDSDQKFYNEDILHSLFFPIREDKNTITTDKQNLWLLDERLTFNNLLASDKTFKQINSLNSNSSDRMDIIIGQEEIFEKATLFSEDKYPFESFTIIEFKKPYRNDYVFGDPKKDPIRQVRKYINEIIENKIKKDGRSIEASKSTLELLT